MVISEHCSIWPRPPSPAPCQHYLGLVAQQLPPHANRAAFFIKVPPTPNESESSGRRKPISDTDPFLCTSTSVNSQKSSLLHKPTLNELFYYFFPSDGGVGEKELYTVLSTALTPSWSIKLPLPRQQHLLENQCVKAFLKGAWTKANLRKSNGWGLRSAANNAADVVGWYLNKDHSNPSLEPTEFMQNSTTGGESPELAPVLEFQTGTHTPWWEAESFGLSTNS